MYTQQTAESSDKWNWGWGDEDNSNVQVQTNTNVNINQQAIVDSFANDESWNWSVDDSNSSTSLIQTKTENITSQDTSRSYQTEEAFPKMGKLAEKHNKTLTEEDVKYVESRNNYKKDKIENITPQWSTESQMSQESSDDVLNNSDCEKILSRSSTISHSPTSAPDPYPEAQNAHLHDPSDSVYYK